MTFFRNSALFCLVKHGSWIEDFLSERMSGSGLISPCDDSRTSLSFLLSRGLFNFLSVLSSS